MKVDKITAYRDQNEGLHYDEKDAIEANIDICIENIGHSCNSSDSNFYKEIKEWALNNPGDLRYILANIKKIDV
jgi:hypothetical protein